MKGIIGLLLFSIVLFSCSETGRHQDYKSVAKYNEYLWLNDNTHETLMDNALRCFQLHSIGSPEDSCIRLWNNEAYYPNRSKTHYLNMFQFDVKGMRLHATFYTLEWKVGKDTQCIVTHIGKKDLQPRSGYAALKKQMDELQLNRIDTIQDNTDFDNMIMDGELKAIQYVYGETTTTVDFTIYTGFLNSKSKKNRKYYELVRLIKDEFSVNLFADHSGYDGFKIYSK